MKPTLNDLTAFLVVAEHLNFRRAATVLGVTPSALSHAMRSLEARVGAQLLTRSTRRVALTAAGAAFAERIGPPLSGIDAALEALAATRDTLSGTVRITAMEFGARLLAERVIGPFRDLHPGVAFVLDVHPQFVDLIAGGYDAGVRLREQVPAEMVAVPLGPPLSMVACAAPAFLGGQPPPGRPEDLDRRACIRQRLASGAIYRWEFERDREAVVLDPAGPLTCNDIGTMVSAALARQGIAFVPSHHVRAHLASGALVQLLADWSPPFDGLCLYYPPNRHPTRTFGAFVAHLRRLGRALDGV